MFGKTYKQFLFDKVFNTKSDFKLKFEESKLNQRSFSFQIVLRSKHFI